MNKKTKLFTLAFIAAGIFSTNTFCMDLSTTQYENLETEYYEYGKKWDHDKFKITWKNKKLNKLKKIEDKKPHKANYFISTYDYQRIIDYEKGCYKKNNKEIKNDEHEKEFAKTVNTYFLLQKKFFHHKKKKSCLKKHLTPLIQKTGKTKAITQNF